MSLKELFFALENKSAYKSVEVWQLRDLQIRYSCERVKSGNEDARKRGGQECGKRRRTEQERGVTTHDSRLFILSH